MLVKQTLRTSVTSSSLHQYPGSKCNCTNNSPDLSILITTTRSTNTSEFLSSSSQAVDLNHVIATSAPADAFVVADVTGKQVQIDSLKKLATAVVTRRYLALMVSKSDT